MPPLPDPPPRDFPLTYARTRRFTLGIPRSFTVAPEGTHVLFLRARGPEDPVTDLWHMDVGTGTERRLLAAGEHAAAETVTAEERDRRERDRDMAEGITAYACDRAVSVAAAAVGGRIVTVDVAAGTTQSEAGADDAFDPRPSPDGTDIAYVSGGALHVVARGGDDRVLVRDGSARWGVADFIAAEEMGRDRGFWWSPDGSRLAVCRVDETAVSEWHLGDPARPATPPRTQRYPAAGTTNADTSLVIVDVVGGGRTEVAWEARAFPYLARVGWGGEGPLTLLVQSRDQRRWRILAVDDDTGATRLLREDHDERWLDLVPGAPTWAGDRLVVVVPTDRGEGGTTSLVVDDEIVTPPGLQVRRILDAGGGIVHVVASEDPLEAHVYRADLDTGDVERLTPRPGVHDAAVVGDTAVVTSTTMDDLVPSVTVRRSGIDAVGVRDDVATPSIAPDVEMLELGDRRLRAGLLRPRHGDHVDGGGPLPVLLDVYGGPHVQRVVRARRPFVVSQWFADQGFAVLVVDGRGTPGRGPEWERAVAGDLAGPVLADQVAALEAAAEHEPRLDLDRVAIRGWSFGGFLAALAVLRHPGTFRAAIAGAPVTDWHLYDTHYTERYLGHPDDNPDAYHRSSLVDDGALVDPAPIPAGRDAPALLLIHGLADDNVVAAHSLRLSSALLAAGRAHRFLPLSGVTHMTPQEVVAANVLRLQASFLREALHRPPRG